MKRAIEDLTDGWVGWHNSLGLGLLDLYSKAQSLDEKASERADHEVIERQLYLTTLFCTGDRVAEAIQLTPKKEQVSWNDEVISISNSPVLKYKDGKVHWRRIDIPRKANLLSDHFIEFVLDAEKKGQQFLLPRLTPFISTPQLMGHTSHQNIYNKINQIYTGEILGSEGIWCHWLRAQTASFLIEVVGLDPYAIKDWFNWSSLEMSSQYFKRSPVQRAEKLGVTALPKVGERS